MTGAHSLNARLAGMRHLLLALLASCATPDSSAGDDGDVVIDARPTGDAPVQSVTSDVICSPYVRTVVAADGSKSVTTNRYGIVATVGPNDEFTVETCGTTYTPPQETCPAGSTCTGTGTPPGVRCFRAYRFGEFVDGKLLVSCGYTTAYYNASGTQTSSGTLSYTSVRVIH